MASLTIGSINCRGLSDNVKRCDMFDKFKNQYDISILVDTHCTNEKEKKWIHEWGYEGKFSSFTSTSRGVAILFKNSFEYKIHDEIIDKQVSFIIFDISILDYSMTLVSLYGPNDDRSTFFDSIKSYILRFDIC